MTYDDYYGIFAARVAWAFRSYGADSRILDGGWTTWIDDTRALTNKDETPEPRVFTAHPRPRLRRTLDDVEGARAQGATLVDARPRHLFLGQAGIANTGHSPARTACPTRSWWTAPRACGPRPTRSDDWREMPGLIPIDRRES